MKERRIKIMKKVLALTVLMVTLFLISSLAYGANISGAIFTTDSFCNGTNVNIFASKEDVYLDGGPARPGSAGLPDGYYFVKVTTPDGVLLGYSPTAVIVVSGGEFEQCYQLWDILVKASDETPGYDTTTNPGGVYKVWISQNSSFPNDESKTDNFKVLAEGGGPPGGVPEATLHVIKFYDANANGLNDDGQLITGWKVNIMDINIDRTTPVTVIVSPGDYTVTEYMPHEINWIATTQNPVYITLNNGDNKTVEFGNVCLGPGGGRTLGFWSNKNGKAVMNDGGTMNPELSLLSGLCLRDGNGNNFDPATYNSFRSWILGANATNMAYMLSAQLAAMALNVEAGFVNGSSLVYAPALLPYAPITGLNSLGFISITNLMNAANTELCTHGTAYSGDLWRAYQEALKNVLDAANKNYNFVQPTPCPFSFPE
jgi:hypothetical protein